MINTLHAQAEPIRLGETLPLETFGFSRANRSNFLKPNFSRRGVLTGNWGGLNKKPRTRCSFVEIETKRFCARDNKFCGVGHKGESGRKRRHRHRPVQLKSKDIRETGAHLHELGRFFQSDGSFSGDGGKNWADSGGPQWGSGVELLIKLTNAACTYL